MLKKALKFASAVHEKHIRISGEPHIQHAVRTMEILKKEDLPQKVLVCALLHDVIEKGDVSGLEIEEKFDLYTREIVEALSKKPKDYFEASRDTYKSYVAFHTQSVSIFSRKHPEILLLKMAEQIDNLQSVEVFREEKKKRQIVKMQKYFLPLYKSAKDTIPTDLGPAFNSLFEQFSQLLSKY